MGKKQYKEEKINWGSIEEAAQKIVENFGIPDIFWFNGDWYTANQKIRFIQKQVDGSWKDIKTGDIVCPTNPTEANNNVPVGTMLEYYDPKKAGLYGNTPIDLEELKKKNENSETCVRCGKATKVLVHTTRYCPDCEFAMCGEEKYSEKKKRQEKEDDEAEITKVNEIDLDIDLDTIDLKIGDTIQIMTQDKGLIKGQEYDGIIALQNHVDLHCKQAQIVKIRVPQGQATKGYVILDIDPALAFHPDWVVKV